jgi:cytochrome c oxidase cbb3-type subunit I
VVEEQQKPGPDQQPEGEPAEELPTEEVPRPPAEPADEREARWKLDEAGRAPVLYAFGSAVVWLLVGSIYGDVASFKFQFPDWLTGQAVFTFGRLRPVHLNAMIYGWASLAMLGVSLWLAPRLVRTPLRWPRLAHLGVTVWNCGLLLGIIGLSAGWTDGLEWLELHRWLADPWLVIGGAMVGGTILRTLLAGQVEHLYVSVWYIAGAFVWFPMLFVTGNLPFQGVESAAVNWFYAHNALGFWLTAVNLAAIYYLIPKVLGRPIYSYHLSLLGFWSLAFFYSLNGMHHLIGGPLPTWMITTSIVASIMMVIPVAAVAVNHHMTMVGRFAALRYSPTLRFIVLGAVAYTAVSLQGSFTALAEVNRITHFTHWTIAHSHVGVYAFVTLVLFGAMYYILPRLVRRDWPDGRLISWHFWLALGGISAYVLALIFGGVLQGMALLDPTQPFQRSVEVTLPWLWIRSLSGLVLTAAHIVFAWHCWRMLREPAPAERAGPAWHLARPVVVEPP